MIVTKLNGQFPITRSMLEEEGMMEGSYVAVPNDPKDLDVGIQWKRQWDLFYVDRKKIEEYFILKYNKKV